MEPVFLKKRKKIFFDDPKLIAYSKCHISLTAAKGVLSISNSNVFKETLEMT